MFRTIANIKGAFCPKVGTIKDKKCRHLVDSEVFPSASDGKESNCTVGDLGSIPGLGRYPGEGNGYLL